jgi:hypothetical protein
MTTADAQKIYDESAGELIPKNFHFCTTHSCIEADQTCAEATANGEDDIVPGRLLWCGLFETNRAYGGREEGGWWYDTGVSVTDARLYAEIGLMPSVHLSISEAKAARDAMRTAAAVLNRDRHEIGSVLCDGIYDAEIHEGKLPAYYPETRPHYE